MKREEVGVTGSRREQGKKGGYKEEEKSEKAREEALGEPPNTGGGSWKLPGAFCPRLDGAATPGETNLVQLDETVRLDDENKEIRFSQGGGFSEVVGWLSSRLDSYFVERCRAKPTGRVFPLPTSDLAFKVAFPQETPKVLGCLRFLCVSLNSLNGEGLYCTTVISSFQKRVLSHLLENCRRVLEWDVQETPASWASFFNIKTVDYRGEEILMAQPIQWENISPALPDEVGSVDLQSVVEMGSAHYVTNFSEYLLPIDDQVYTKPPKVHVPAEAWTKVCEGLLAKGICQVIHESEIYHVHGQPLLNGLFGVSKHEFCNGYETRRLIMNMIPLNRICRGISGDVSTLPSWANMSALHLMPHEDLVVSSEDVRCFFYIFRVPQEWHGFLAFNKPVPHHLRGPLPGVYYLCSSVLPMGFKNSVSLAQQVHRVVVRRAMVHSGMALGSESEIRKDRTFPGGGHLFRVYLDNFDELKKVNRHLAETIEGKLSAMSLGLREEYLRLQIPRHPKKSVQQQRVAEVQGAIVDGSRGLAYPKPEKVMKYCQLACHLLARGRCTQRQAQVIGGGFVYLAMFRRPLLGSMNALWQFIVSFEHFPPVISLDLPEAVKEELARFVGLSPLSVVNFRLDLSQCVTASDASEYGGGVTFSRGLTEAGACAARCSVRGDIVEPLEVESVLTVGLFDGISALRVAVDSLGWNILGHVSVESNEEARRVVESRFPSTRFVTDIVLVDEAEVKEWACLFSQASLVLLGSGAPCQGVSQLNAQRKGALRDSRSALFQHVPRVKALVQKFFPWARVASLAENVASMDEQDRKVMTEAFGDTPWMIDGKDFSIARRPRLYWFDWELVAQEGVTFQLSRDSSSSACHTAKVLTQVDERDYLHPGWTRQEVQPLPTFTTSRCRDYEGHRPAGKAQCQAHELERWKADHYRYPPYQYQDKNCLQQRSSGELRLPDIEERECIMGFPRGYTMQAMKKTLHNTPGHLASRLSMIGNSWNVTVVAWILNHLGYLLGFHPLLSPQQIVERTAPGSTHSLQAYLQRPPMRQQSTKVRGQLGHQLVRKLSSLVSLKGEDLLLQAGSEDLVRYQRMRASLPARLWRWRVASSWQWRGGREHINVLEMRAVLNALRWRLERQSQVKIKFVHMVDSLVCLHSLSRGRSSSRKLRRTLLRVNSLLLATGSSVVWSYVHTSLNPADAPSRRPRKRKWANA